MNKKPILVLGLLLGMALTACAGSASTSNTSLLTLEDIPDGFDGPEILTLGSDSASVRFDTGVPTVCNAPFGETTDYGEVATIPMFSGATLDHVLTFSGLDPDTTYHYKITATDNQGNVYQSDDFTFTTLPEEDDTLTFAGEPNWLSTDLGASVLEVSSNFGGARSDQQWGANSAIDDNDSTAWSSNGDGDEAFIEIALPEAVQITSIIAFTRTMSNSTAQIFSFTVTNDTGEVFGPFELADASQAYEFAVDFVASTLRFDVEASSGGNTGFVELEAYGEAVGGP